METILFTRHLIRAGLLLVALISFSAQFASAATPVPLADFFRKPAMMNAVLSPSGKSIAVLVGAGEPQRMALAVADPKDITKIKVVAAFLDADIRDIYWVNNERLVFTVTDAQSPLANQIGEGLYAVDREGKEAVRALIRRNWYAPTEASHIGDRLLSPAHLFHSILRDGSNDVVVSEYVFDQVGDLSSIALKRLDTTTGRTTNLVEGAPPHAKSWAIDSHGMPRAVIAESEGKSRLYWKPLADASWRLVREYDSIRSEGLGIDPLGVDANDNLYFRGFNGPRADTVSLMRLNLRQADAPAQALIELKGFDFVGDVVVRNNGELLGAHYLTDAVGTHWFLPALQDIQKHVDKLLPDTINVIDCGDCENPAVVLVKSESDRQPVAYRLYDVATDRLQPIGSSRPWIAPATMARRDFERIKARDGLDLPLYVTRPKDTAGPAPMIVMVHGGPWVRGGQWNWDGESQFLASRGYVVVEPEFRGGLGFGSRHYVAGWKQWGLTMQDDVADAARWAIKQGYADPKRICIAGASYGGYATLMGLIRDPDLYRCGVEWVGVTDIDLMFSIYWSDTSVDEKRYDLTTLIGDRTKDAQRLAETSPLKRADEIKQPLLMAYGGIDRRVPIAHGTAFRDAISGHNPNVEWIVYPSEGHGWYLEANDIDFWTHVDRFLDKNLRAAP